MAQPGPRPYIVSLPGCSLHCTLFSLFVPSPQVSLALATYTHTTHAAHSTVHYSPTHLPSLALVRDPLPSLNYRHTAQHLYMHVSTPVPHVIQSSTWDCGLACVCAIAQAQGCNLSLAEVTLLMGSSKRLAAPSCPQWSCLFSPYIGPCIHLYRLHASAIALSFSSSTALPCPF